MGSADVNDTIQTEHMYVETLSGHEMQPPLTRIHVLRTLKERSSCHAVLHIPYCNSLVWRDVLSRATIKSSSKNSVPRTHQITATILILA